MNFKILILPLLFISTLLTAQLHRDSVYVINDFSRLVNFQFSDVDSDGDMDIIASQRGFNGNYILYKNTDGQGNYAPGQAFGEKTWEGEPNVLTNFSMGDMDGDGDVDMVSGNIVRSTHPFRINDGTGQFQLVPGTYDYSTDQNDQSQQAVLDLDDDDDLDVLMFKYSYNAIFELHFNRNNGPGEDFELLPIVELDEASASVLKGWFLSDIDQDGDTDIGYVVQTSQWNENKKLQMVILENTCNYCYTEISRIDLDEVQGYYNFIKIETAQLDDDSYPDVIVNYETTETDNNGDHDTPILSIWKNENGTGDFSQMLHEEKYTCFTFGDVDNDGDTDLVAGFHTAENDHTAYSEDYYLWENTGDFEFDTILIDELYSGQILDLEDINSDGILDMVSLVDKGNFLVRWGLPNGEFSELESLNIATDRVYDIFPTDRDGDGDLDLISLGNSNIDGTGSSGLFFNENLGDGIFGPLELLNPVDYNYFTDVGELALLNDDEFPDALVLEVVNTDDGQKNILKCYLTNETGGYEESFYLNPDFYTRIEAFNVSDFDNDGDLDVLWHALTGEIYISWNDLDQSGTFINEMTNLSSGDLVNSWGGIILKSIRIDEDLLPDLFFGKSNQFWWAKKLEEGAQFSDWRPIQFPEELQTFRMKIETNLDEDPTAELFFEGRLGNGPIHSFVSDYQSEVDSFSTPRIIRYGQNNVLFFIYPIDFNEDGLLDLVSHGGFALNIPQSDIFTTYYAPTPFDEAYFPFIRNVFLADLDNDGEKELGSAYESTIYYNKQFLEGKTLRGFLRWDSTAGCNYDDSNQGMSGWNISLSHSQNEQLISSNTEGEYGAFLPQDGMYTISPIPPSGYWTVCPEDSVLTIEPASPNPDSINFVVEALVDCPLVVIDMSSTTVSQCFTSSVSIAYYNAGTANANEATIELTFDNRLTPLTSNINWASETDTSLFFTFDVIEVGERGFINITFEPDCEQLVLDEEICFEAHVTPADLCEDMLVDWSGANLEATSFCADGQVAFSISNTGENAMNMAEQYYVNIVNDDIILFESDDVILGPGESDTIWLPIIEDGFWNLVINQPQGHPYPEPISLSASSCTDEGGPNPPVLPNGDGDPFSEVYCTIVTGPYDPNDKSATPAGLGELNIIEREWELTYTIQFQNTGNDKAKNVVLQDQLSEWLDLSSFRAIGGSHEYNWMITGERNLIITYPEINLPDSTANEPESHGFFTFAITPRTDVPVETIISNYANIYFDLNPPIQTSTVFHQIRKPVHASALHAQICAGEQYLGMEFFQDTILQEIQNFMEYDSITFHHLSVLNLNTTTEEINFENSITWEGIQIENDTVIERIFTAENGCDSILVYQFNLINNTSNPQKTNNYTLTPNPAKDFSVLKIKNGASDINRLELLSSNGLLVRRWQPTLTADNSTRIDLFDLPPGSYILNVVKETDKIGLKLIVE